jgi:hypothetical protein
VLVFDTSAYINGQHDHLPPATFPSVWLIIEAAIEDGRILLPREVFRELTAKDDDVAGWIRRHAGVVAEPSETVQRNAGRILQEFPRSHVRNPADPFIIAEALARGFTVTTYEGRSFSGVPTARWARTMPGICQRFGVPCCTLPEALTMLGASI